MLCYLCCRPLRPLLLLLLMCLSIACSLSSSSPPTTEIVDTRGELAQEHTASSRQKRPRFYYELANDDDEDEGGGEGEEEEEDDASEDEEAAEGQRKGGRRRRRRRTRRTTKAFGQDAYLLPENFRSLRRKDIPVTYRLHDDLLRYYRKGTRPVTHPSKIISVSMSVFLYQIIKLDAVKNTISLSGSFELYWQDEFLQWDPDSYEGAAEIFLASTDIWIPEFSLYYSVNFNDAVKLQSNNDVRVNYTGHVRYWIPFSTESLCNSVDVKFFPFDIQRCTLLLGSWAHSNDSIKYSLYSKNLSLIDFYDNQEWQLDLSQSHITSDGFLYDYLDPPLFWEMIVIDLVVSRQSFYYVFNLVIPSAIITLVAVIGFHTPSTSGKMRDAKFRLGIMTLMSMSMILLAIVEDMPKFSISSSRKGRGSFSGIPLIGLYYFMLLAIVGLSTVTSSMFVFVERNVRIHHYIPFYLRWMIAIEQRKRNFSKRYSFRGSRNKRKAAEAKRQQQQQQDGGGEMDTLLFSPHAESATTPHGHLNGFVGLVGGSDSNLLAEGQNSRRTKRVAMSLLRLIATDKDRGDTVVPPRHSQSGHFRQSAPRGSAGRLKGRSAERLSQQDLDSPTRHSSATRNPPSPFQRKRHSLLHYDSMAVYQCYQQLVEELALGLCRVERTVLGIRQDLAAMVPQNDMESDWQKAIRRLELLSLVFYVTLLFATMLLFFYHDWYCAIGHNPCGQQNLKCPWLVSDPSQPSCLT